MESRNDIRPLAAGDFRDFTQTYVTKFSQRIREVPVI